jgi:hypothetical protein
MLVEWRKQIQNKLRRDDITQHVPDDELNSFIEEVSERWDNPYDSLRQRHGDFPTAVAELFRNRFLTAEVPK